MDCAATAAEMEPLNLSGAMRMRIGVVSMGGTRVARRRATTYSEFSGGTCGSTQQGGNPFALPSHFQWLQVLPGECFQDIYFLVAHYSGDDQRPTTSERLCQLRRNLDKDCGIEIGSDNVPRALRRPRKDLQAGCVADVRTRPVEAAASRLS